MSNPTFRLKFALLSLSLVTASPLTVLLLLSSFPMACASMKVLLGQEPLRPKIELNEILLQSWDANEVTLLVDLKVTNANEIDLELKRLHYELEMDGQSLAKGDMDRLPKLPAEQSVQVLMPLKVALAPLLALVVKMARTATKPKAKISMHFDITTLFGDMRVERVIEKDISDLLKK